MSCCCEEKKELGIYLVPDGIMPEYKTEGASGLDCHARLACDFIKIPKKSRCLVNLGFALELPEGYEAQIRPRSGNTSKGIDIGFGTIDFDFKGEVKACVINNSDGDFEIHNGDRICQLVIQKVEKFPIKQVDHLSKTKRGTSGIGSTGIK